MSVGWITNKHRVKFTCPESILLKEELGEGAVEVKQIFGDARAAGIECEKTLRRAKNRLGIKARREGGVAKLGLWVWELPR